MIPCPHCRGTGHEPFEDLEFGVTVYGENELCENCSVCYGFKVVEEQMTSDTEDRLDQYVEKYMK